MNEWMTQVELNNMYEYINIGANSDSEKLWTRKQNTATFGKLIKAVYA